MRAGAQADFAAVADVSPCATLLAAIHARKTGAAAVRAMWRGEQDFRDPICINAYRHARRDGMLTENDMREKLHGLAGSRLLVSSRRFLRHFPISGLSYRAVRKVVFACGAAYSRQTFAGDSRESFFGDDCRDGGGETRFRIVGAAMGGIFALF